ncbi:hypothetical protein AABD61_10145 [Edwardsiella piscicida]|uniref:hypothetical protein n=1 Tax=Edwardsiella piscicida TaxID=1263550 RepID=UPI00370D308C
MKTDYAKKINALLECFYFNNELVGMPYDNSLGLLRHGISHLYFLAVCSGEVDVATIEEIRKLTIEITEGNVPQPYDLSAIRHTETGRQTRSSYASIRKDELIEHFAALDFDLFRNDTKHIMDIIAFRLKSYLKPSLSLTNANICSEVARSVVKTASVVFMVKEVSETRGVSMDDLLTINRAIAELADKLQRAMVGYKADSLSR